MKAAKKDPRADTLLLTCEHAGNRIPREYQALFRSAAGALFPIEVGIQGP